MSAHQHDRNWARDDYRPRSRHYSDGKRRPDENYARPYSKDHQRRSPSPRPQYSSSPHDRYSNLPDRDEIQIKGASIRLEREKRLARENETNRSSSNNWRGRSPNSRDSTRPTYRDRDREKRRSPSYDSRTRSQSGSERHGRSRSRSQTRQRDRSPYYGGPPSREVILEGLKADAVEEDISKELKQYHDVRNLEDVRIIRDRQTKLPRGFGFIRFPTIGEARSFLEKNYPAIYLYGQSNSDNDDEAAKVRIAFSREREDRRIEKADGEWTCKICTFANFPGRTRCHRCQTPQIDVAAYGTGAPAKTQYMNSGDSDASPNGTPSQFLLLRGLEPTVTEDLLAKGVAKLYKPSRRQSPPSAAISKKGSSKVASTTGDANLGAKEGTLRRILLVRDRRSNESWRYGFAEFASIEDAQAAIIRYNSFEKFTISSKPVTADYVHAGIFVPVLNPKESGGRFTFSPLGNSTTKLAYWDEEAWASELIVSIGSPEADDVSGENRVRAAANELAVAAEKEGLLKPEKETEFRSKKRKADIAAASKQKKTAPAHLQFWSNRHAELHGVKPENSDDGEDHSNDNKEVRAHLKMSTPSQSYADSVKQCCYLCSRQFKTDTEVNKHERLSQLHRDNLQNEDLVQMAETKMAKAGLPVSAAVADASEYRDRAKERRAAFGASKKISLPLKKPKTQQEDDTPENVNPLPSKGASLLGKMGWSAGEGLGAKGTGMTAPIATDMYVQGVGLGAHGGKIGDAAGEAERNTKGDYGEFLERTRDKAKERFEKMA